MRHIRSLAGGLAMAIWLALPAAAAEPGSNGLMAGAAWYPEQWPETRWAADLDLMRAANMDVVRIGEFSWSTLEPREGKFEFG